MPNLRYLARRSPVEWTVRSTLAIIAAALGYLAVSQSLATVMQYTKPAKAHRLAPDNGVIMGRLSQALSEPHATNADRAQSDSIARLALLRDPVSVEAVATLGTNAQLRGDTASARRLFAYSQFLSRRDVRTQIWAIQAAAARGDIPATLKHYDTILRTSRVAATTLLPALAAAISYPDIRAALVKTLSHQPSWTQGFINYVSARGPDPEATASFLRALRHARVPVSEAATASLVKALINAGKFEQAWAYYASIHPGANRQASRDPQFAANFAPPSLFDWRSANDGGISASIQRSGENSVFIFSAPAITGGQVLQQIEMLPPGDYVLRGESEDIDQPDDTRPYWSLSCHGGRKLGRIDMPNSTVANGSFSGRFTIPADCPVQVLALNIRPSNEISGVMGQINQISLRPAR